MSTIPVSLTEKQFNEHVLPYISQGKRTYWTFDKEGGTARKYEA